MVNKTHKGFRHFFYIFFIFTHQKYSIPKIIEVSVENTQFSRHKNRNKFQKYRQGNKNIDKET